MATPPALLLARPQMNQTRGCDSGSQHGATAQAWPVARKGFRSRLECAGTSSLACSQPGEEPDRRQHQQQWLGEGSRCPSGLSIEHEPCWWRGLYPALEAQLGAGKAHPGEALAGTVSAQSKRLSRCQSHSTSP